MFYEFKVTYWDDFNDRDEQEQGLVWAEDYGEAAQKLKDDYGRELIDMYLQEWDTANTISLDEIKEGFHLPN